MIFYTDGVTEAFNATDECYGNDRLLADAGAFSGMSAQAMTTRVLANVRQFVGTAPQSDDIAILTLQIGNGAAMAGRREVSA